MGSQGLKQQARSSVCVPWLLAGCFCQSPKSGSYGVSDFCLLLGLFLLGCLVQAQYIRALDLSHYFFFVVVVVVKTMYLFM